MSSMGSVRQNLDEIVRLINYSKNIIAHRITDGKELLEQKLKKSDPSSFRRFTERTENLRRSVEDSLIDDDNLIIQVDDIIGNLKPIKSMIREHIDLMNEYTREINKMQIGTLEGLARGAIAQGRIVPKEGDIIAKSVLEQPYNESDVINRGGKRKNKKTRKGFRKVQRKNRTTKMR